MYMIIDMYVSLSPSVSPLQFGQLAVLQAGVNEESMEHKQLLEERDEMLQRVSE